MTETRIIDDEYASPDERFQGYLELFSLTKERIIPFEYLDHFCIDEQRLTQVVQMYLKDRKRLKEENGMERLHRSKVAAYLIKWILICRPLYTTVGPDTWDEMNEECRLAVLDITYMFAIHIMFHTLDEFVPQDFYPEKKFQRVLDDLITTMRLGTYCEQTAAILFDAIAAHYAEVNGDVNDIPVNYL